uniref:Palmitoyl-protein thioesterase 1 n=1 Tax=Culicoides sonorensis TaxID=179676 RepID=A0A336MXR0_CULSO
MYKKLLLIVSLVLVIKGEPTPIVLWHGMGDSCCSPSSLGRFKRTLEEEIPGVYVLSLKITGESGNYDSSYFIHPNQQVREACNKIANDSLLQTGFNGIGFSQGGLFMRALQQQCPKIKMINLITLGSPHQGVFGLPNCLAQNNDSCKFFRGLLNHGAYLNWVQKFLVQATYWHDPLHEDKYRKYSSFLADVNNENDINQDYVIRLRALKKLILVKFSNDTIVQPRESQWFGYYRPGQDTELIEMEQTALFKEDRLGLKAMKESGQLIMLESDGNHLEYSRTWFNENILPVLLNENESKNDLK